jgi:hypothetical protein
MGIRLHMSTRDFPRSRTRQCYRRIGSKTVPLAARAGKCFISNVQSGRFVEAFWNAFGRAKKKARPLVENRTFGGVMYANATEVYHPDGDCNTLATVPRYRPNSTLRCTTTEGLRTRQTADDLPLNFPRWPAPFAATVSVQQDRYASTAVMTGLPSLAATLRHECIL